MPVAVCVPGPGIGFCKTLPADCRRHTVLLAVFLDDYQELLVQRVVAVSTSGGIIPGGFVELVYPRFPGLVRPPCPALLLELVGQFTAWVRVNAFRRGEHHLHLGEASVAAEVGIAAVADVDYVLAGD